MRVLYGFRRQHEGEMRLRGLTDPIWQERLIQACHHKAATLRGHLSLNQHCRGKLKLTRKRIAAIERNIAKADREVVKFVRELYGTDDWQRFYTEGLRQLTFPRHVANGDQADRHAVEPPEAVLNDPRPPKGKAEKEAKPPDPQRVYSESAEISAPNAKQLPLPTALIPESVETSAKPPNPRATASQAVAPAQPKAESTVERPQAVEPPPPAVAPPSWMPMTDEFTAMCNFYYSKGYNRFPIGRDERGQWIFTRRVEPRPLPKVVDSSDTWPDGTKKGLYQM
jgi:hypothetical protein